MRFRNPILFTILVAFSAASFAENGEFTGDTKLSCEAILCLSSGERPGECSPSLSRYFGIKKKKFSDTLKARRNFLNICPTASAPDMPALVNALVNGAGRCDSSLAALLNSQEQRCQKGGGGFGGSVKACLARIKIPAYCQTYASHPYTRIDLPVREKVCPRFGKCTYKWVMPAKS